MAILTFEELRALDQSGHAVYVYVRLGKARVDGHKVYDVGKKTAAKWSEYRREQNA